MGMMAIEVRECRLRWMLMKLKVDVRAGESIIERKTTRCNCFASLHFNRPGPTVHSRSCCPLGSR